MLFSEIYYDNLIIERRMNMTKFDKDYLELVKKILTEGVEVENRTGINTLKVPTHTFEFDLSCNFPILETKEFYARAAITEMLWIWQMQSNDIRELQKRNVKIWNEWMIDEDGIYRIYEPVVPGKEYVYEPEKEVVVMDPLSVPISDPFGYRNKMQPKYDESGKVMMAKSKLPGKTIKTAKYFGKEYAYTDGTAYGWITNRYEMTQDLQHTLRNYPTDRRIVKSLWQNEFLRTAVLPSCVWSTEWDITNGKLNLLVHQRSCDVPLGLPFNVTQYATFLKMIAQTTGLEPGVIAYSIKDAHIYVNQIDKMEEQLWRFNRYNELKTWNETKLFQYKQHLERQLKENINSNDKKYLRKLDSEYRMIDMIFNPTTPELWLNPEIDDFFNFDNSSELKDSKVKKYKHMGKLPIPIAQ